MMTILATDAGSTSPHGRNPAVTASRSLALRERAALRLAARRGEIAVALRSRGRTLRDGYDKLEVLAGLAERGLLQWSGLRGVGGEVEAVYSL